MDFCISDADDIDFSKKQDEGMLIHFIDFDAFASQYRFSMNYHYCVPGNFVFPLGLMSNEIFYSMDKAEKLR